MQKIIEIKCLTIFKDFTMDILLRDSQIKKTKRVIDFLYYDSKSGKILLDE